MLENIRKALHPVVKMYPETMESLPSLPKEFLTPIVVNHINKTILSGGAIVTLRRGMEYLSLAIMRYAGKDLSLQYVMTANAHRHQGYGRQLVEQLLSVSDKEKKITASINTSNAYSAYMTRILTKLQFRLVGHYCTYVFPIAALMAEEGYKRKAQRFYTALMDRGYECFSLQEAPGALLEQLRNSAYSDFRNPLHPEALLDMPNCILMEHSFLLAKDGALLAYTILSPNGKNTIEWDHWAVHAAYRTMGFALAPALRSFERLLEDQEIHQIIFQIFEDNAVCRQLVRKLLPHKQTVFEMDYYCHKE